MQTDRKDLLQSYFFSILGGLIGAASLNLFIIPLGLFSGNFIGIAQMIDALLREGMRLSIPGSFNLSGLILFLINIPLMVIAFREISRTFFFKSVLTVLFQSAAMLVIPIPSSPLIEDMLTSSIIGGLILGLGAGLTLRSGGSGGGTDILGVYLIKKFPHVSVGRISMVVSAFVFGYCLIRYDLNVVVYSIIFTAVSAITLDRAHYQNIKSSAIIFTRNPEVGNTILQELHRGATCWNGYGAYTHEPTYIFMTVVSKFETARIKKIVRDLDPHSFTVFIDHLDVSGNFLRKL